MATMARRARMDFIMVWLIVDRGGDVWKIPPF
jgi:hypothetical protein